jgi:hypothetical protein
MISASTATSVISTHNKAFIFQGFALEIFALFFGRGVVGENVVVS